MLFVAPSGATRTSAWINDNPDDRSGRIWIRLEPDE